MENILSMELGTGGCTQKAELIATGCLLWMLHIYYPWSLLKAKGTVGF